MSEVSSPATTDDVRQVAATLAEALPYAQRHAGHTFVIKYGGAAMGIRSSSPPLPATSCS